MKYRLTKSYIDRLTVDKRTRITDTQTPQLTLRANPNGKHVFYYRARHRAAGLIERKIGPVGQWTLDQARDEAIKIAADFNQGIDPHKKKKEDQRNNLTLGELIDKFSEWNHRRATQGEISKNTCDLYHREVRRIRPGFEHRRVQEITRRQLQEYLDTLDIAASTENQTIIAVRFMYRYAQKELQINTGNPAQDLKRKRTQPRDRYLQSDEVGRLFDTLAQEDEYWQHLALILIFTGQRKGNVYQMEWREIDMERQTWTIPASKAKTRSQITVALIDEAMTIIKARYSKRNSQYVFPNRTNPDKPLIVTQYRWWMRIRERAGLQDLTIHDLRRTLASWQAKEGVGIHQIAQSLGHANISTTAKIYAHLDTSSTRGGIQKAVGAMNRARQKAPPANEIDALVEGLTPEEREALLQRLRSMGD